MLRVIVWTIACIAAASVSAGDAGVTPTEIRLGASAVLSGPLGGQTQAYGQGSRLYFDSVNANGGVNGRKISYTTLDDGFDMQRAVANTRKLIKDANIFMVYNNTGTGQTGAILPLLEESQTIVFGPVTGASMFRTQFNPLMFHVRASYAHEAQRIMSQLKLSGVSRVAILHQDDALGSTILTELNNAAAAQKMAFVGVVKVDAKQQDLSVAASAIEKLAPQVVILGTAGLTFTNCIKAVLKTSIKPGFYGFSVVSLDVINRELKEQARGIILAQIMPSMRNKTIPVVAEYLQLLHDSAPTATPSASQFEGFVHAKVLVTGLRRAGRNLNGESFIKAMETGGDIRFGQFVAKYSPQSHNGSSYVELAIVDHAGQLRY